MMIRERYGFNYIIFMHEKYIDSGYVVSAALRLLSINYQPTHSYYYSTLINKKLCTALLHTKDMTEVVIKLLLLCTVTPAGICTFSSTH